MGKLQANNDENPLKSIQLYYVTDPICSHCWAFEPVIRRFLLQYGEYFDFYTVMGGLLEEWGDGPIDPENGIYTPADVVSHWREVGVHARMPIDGSLMIDNPVESSYPPSRVFKIVQKRYHDKVANVYLRRIREALFVFNRNISDIAVLVDILNNMNLNGESIVTEAEQHIGQKLLDEDFTLAHNMSVEGFPTIIMKNKQNETVNIFGSRPLVEYVNELKKSLNIEELQAKQQPSLRSLLEEEKLLFYKEIEVMYDVEPSDVDAFIKRELSLEYYQVKEVLGEHYIITII